MKVQLFSTSGDQFGATKDGFLFCAFFRRFWTFIWGYVMETNALVVEVTNFSLTCEQ